MKNLKISTRLLVLVGVLSALLVAIGAVGLLGIAKSNATMESMYLNRMQTQSAVAEFQFLTMRNRQLISNALLSPAPEKIIKATVEAEANIIKLNKVWASLQATSLGGEGDALIKAITAKQQKRSVRLDPVHRIADRKFPIWVVGVGDFNRQRPATGIAHL